MSNQENKFINAVSSIVNSELNNNNLLMGEWHLGTVNEVISPYLIFVSINGSSPVTCPCNPNVLFKQNDSVFVIYINGDVNNKFAISKRATGTESLTSAHILSGGNKIQSGIGSAPLTMNTQGTINVFFPTTFTNTPFVLVGLNSSFGNTGWGWVAAQSPTPTGFTCYYSSNVTGTMNFTWIAIGK